MLRPLSCISLIALVFTALPAVAEDPKTVPKDLGLPAIITGDCVNMVMAARQLKLLSCPSPKDPDQCVRASNALSRVCWSCGSYCTPGEDGRS